MSKIVSIHPELPPVEPGTERVWDVLSTVTDPEVPVLNVVELGVVRGVHLDGTKLQVTITPTYSGCPAMKVIEDDITSALQKNGYENLHVETILSPAWTTDWMTEEAREKLRRYGIAPPEHTTADKNVLFGKPKIVKCPRCGSEHTTMISQFGSTACKALWRCDDCKEPFDYFKCI